jgi:hypothetical protein
MQLAICAECADDVHFKTLIEENSEQLQCSVCGEPDSPAIGVIELGKLIEPIMREHFQHGPTVRKFGEDDHDWWEQEGEPIAWAVQQVLGQYFDFEDVIVDAVMEAKDVRPQDGEEAFWDSTSLYVETRVKVGHYYAQWRSTLEELKHGRRFFSPAAQALFTSLFAGVEDQKAWIEGKYEPVVYLLPTGTELYRARICSSSSLLRDVMADPFNHVGPAPKETARAGRMNAEGVPVFYSALDKDTCLAEMRPAIGNELAVITVRTSKPLRMLDFSRLEAARGGKALSYLQPDFTQEVEKRAFLRRLHSLVSQPIVPGHEADYLITQTMAEYLAHVHNEPFDGVLFASAQRTGGRNVVLFAERELLDPTPAEAFRIEYVERSVAIHTTKSIEYAHEELDVTVGDNGDVYLYDGTDDEEGDRGRDAHY